MPRKQTIITFALLALGLGLVLTAGVRTAAADSKSKSESKKFFQNGMKLYNQDQFEQALVEFHKAYVTYPNPKIRKNTGLCYMKLGDNVQALQEFTAYLEEAKGELSGKEKDSGMNLIFSLLEFVGILRFTNVPDKAEVTIDSQLQTGAAAGKDVYVDPGVHVVTVVGSDDQVLYREEISINDGEQKDVDVGKAQWTLKAGAANKSSIPDWKEVKARKPTQVRKIRPALFGVVFTLTLLSSGALIGTYISAKQRNDDFKNSTDPDEQARLKDEGQTLLTATNALWGVVGGLATLTVLIAIFTDFRGGKKKRESQPLTGLSLLPDPRTGSLVLNAGFQF